MKKFIIILMFALSFAISTSAQEFVAPVKGQREVYTDTTTTFTYKMSEKTYNVYKSKNGAFYIWKISKRSGNPYKYYLPKEIQKEMGRKYNE